MTDGEAKHGVATTEETATRGIIDICLALVELDGKWGERAERKVGETMGTLSRRVRWSVAPSGRMKQCHTNLR